MDIEEIEAQARGCQLELTSERNLQIIGDPDLLRSGFENILRNAIRYAPTDSCVELTAQKDGTCIVIQICDRGPGIPEQYLDRIFEPFFRVKNSVADASGSGLGLAIAQRAFEVHGGSIVATPRDGGGLIFTVTLPAADLT